MRTSRTALLGAVAAAAIGLAGTASAQTPQTHVMTVALPGGGTAEIRYSGNVPPQVVVSDQPASFAAWSPVASFFGPASPFAMMERISAEMDRQTAARFGQAEALAAQARSGQLTETSIRNLPPGTQGY